MWFLCDDERPLTEDRARAILSEAPDGVFEGVCLACEPEAEALFAAADTLFAPGIAAGAGGAVKLPSDMTEWEAEGLLRRAACRVLDDIGGELYEGARRTAADRAARRLIRQGVL